MTWEADVDAFEASCGMVDLPWSKLRFTGPDRKKFLNGLLTNDVGRLAENHGLAACLLTPKGMLRAHFLLYDVGGALLALCPPESAPNLAAVMKKMIVLSESKVEDVSGSYDLVLLAGPKTAGVVEQAAPG